jgi:predicted Zn-dependent protease with MMP-like domain
LPIQWLGGRSRRPRFDELHVIAEEAYRRLPDKFRALCEGLVIHVDEFPTDDVLDELKAETEFDLLGLFQGVGLPFQSESAPVQMPNMVWLYRVPILLYWAEHDETLGTIVTHVLGARDRPPFRPLGRRHGGDRGERGMSGYLMSSTIFCTIGAGVS